MAWSVAWVEPEEIDQIDILNSRIKAMERAAEGLSPAADYLLVDGNRDHGSRCAIQMPHETVVKGTAARPASAAPRSWPRVSRTAIEEMAARYPQYEFQRHQGLPPPKLHYERLRQYGPCPIHRRSFLKKLWSGGQEARAAGPVGGGAGGPGPGGKGMDHPGAQLPLPVWRADIVAAREGVLAFRGGQAPPGKCFRPGTGLCHRRQTAQACARRRSCTCRSSRVSSSPGSTWRRCTPPGAGNCQSLYYLYRERLLRR